MRLLTKAVWLPLLASGCVTDASRCPADRPFGGGGSFLGGQCWDRGFFESGLLGTDTGGSSDGPLLIDSFSYNCLPEGWEYTFATSGPSSGGLLTLDEDTAPPWHEEHDVTGVTTLDVVLPFAASPATQASNVDTAFPCESEARMVFRIDLFDVDNTLSDCVIWSGSETDPSVIWGPDFSGCANGNSW